MFTENFDFWRHFHEKLTYDGGGGGGGGGRGYYLKRWHEQLADLRGDLGKNLG